MTTVLGMPIPKTNIDEPNPDGGVEAVPADKPSIHIGDKGPIVGILHRSITGYGRRTCRSC